MSELFKKNIWIRTGIAVVSCLSSVRLVPHIAVLLLGPHRDLMWKDLDRFADAYDNKKSASVLHRIAFFIWAMTFLPEYRNVFYFRHRTFRHVLGPLCPPMRYLGIFAGSCGPGLFVNHGFGTLVTAERIGSNFSVLQLVTVGFANNTVDCPTIGDNVTIGAGARVLGAVTIGDDATIAPNSVVLSDVPAGATVMGVPAKVILRKRPAAEGEG